MNTKTRFTRLTGLALVTLILLWGAFTALAQTATADLSIAKTVDNPTPFDGNTIVFSLTATNNGPDAASGISVADALPAGVTYASDDGAGAYDSLAGLWTVGSLAASSSVTLNITATVNLNTDGATISNIAVISSLETDPNAANNTAQVDIQVRINDLCARSDGSLSLPGRAPLSMWGYAPGDCSSGNPAQLPGPALVYQQDEAVSLTLHNGLSGATALHFEGQGLIPDLSGVPAGGQKTYAFTANKPGTFLYEAAALPNAQHQPAMGLYGPLVVQSAIANQAFDDPSSAFDSEALIVLSEVDPALNSSTNPAAFDMRKYKARYWLINGKAYPNTDPIPTAAGNRVLLRYVNAGQLPYTMTILGIQQKLLSLGGAELPYYRLSLSQMLSPGQSSDAIAVVPASALAGARFPFYESGLLLHNNGGAGYGGMLTFLDVPVGPPGGDLTGPATSGLVLSPNPTNGTVDVLLSATINDGGSGDANIATAEYFIGAPGADGAGTLMSATDGNFDSPLELVNSTILTDTLVNLPSGTHLIYVHGQDANGNWGPTNFIALNLDKMGPAVTGIIQTPAASNGTVNIAVRATANDTMSGGSNIAAGEYFIDIDLLNPPTAGTGAPLSPNQTDPVAELNGSIPAAIVGALPEGEHTLYIRALDAQGNWGAIATAALKVDQSGPTASNLLTAPSPTNGSATVRVDAAISDPLNPPTNGANSNITNAEAFIDTVGSPGTGLPFMSLDGLFNSTSENVYTFIPQTQVNALSSGAHTIYVRGKDAAGNWGATSSTSLVIDKTRPTVSGLSVTPNPTGGAATVTLTGTATDATTNISAAEWFRGADPGQGFATPMGAVDGTFNSLSEGLTANINVTGWPAGNNTLSVRAKDAAGNWSLVGTVVVTVQAGDLIFADSFGSGNTSAWNGGAAGPVSVTAAASMAGTPAFGMQVAIAGTTPSTVTDNSPTGETAYHARFYFNPRSTLTGGTQIDIFAARNAAGTNVVRVQYRRTATAGGTYQVRLAIARAGGTTTTPWITITNNTAHSLELDWQSAASATIRFYVDGVLRQTITGQNTSAFLVDTAVLGPSAGLVAAASGTPYFDQFESRRFSYIGP